MSEDAVTPPALAGVELELSQPIIYDRPIGLRLLYWDPVIGAVPYLVRYPGGMAAQRHTHTSAAEFNRTMTSRESPISAPTDPSELR